MATGGQRGRGWCIAAMVACLGCADDGGVATTTGDAGCSWGSCDASGPRCVATGVADGSWLTTDWEEGSGAACSMVPPELTEAGTPGRYLAGNAPIGEIRCEGLRRGAATLRARVRVRMLSAQEATPSACHCSEGWDVAMHVVVEAQETWSIDGLMAGGGVTDPSCQRGPDVEQDIPVTVGADGRVEARIELGRCNRAGPTACLFLTGTSFSVVQ